MVKLKYVFLILVLIVCIIPAYCQLFEKVPEEQVDQSKTELAKKFANHFFSALKDGKTYEFHGEATDMLIQNLTPEKQTQLYKYIVEQFGEYQSLEYAETRKYAPESMTIVRFKGICDQSKGIPEIQVVLDKDNKIAGFWLFPWKDEL